MAKPTNDPSNYLAIGVQSAQNVEATTFFFTKHLQGSGFEVTTEVQSEREGGDGQEVGLRYVSKMTADGQLVSNARPGALGRLWAWTLGQDTVASVAVGADHTAVPVSTQPFLTVEQRAPDDLIERTTNNLITTLTEEFEAGKPLKVTAAYLSGGSVARRPAASSLTPTRETLAPIQYPNASVVLKVGDGAGGTATAIAFTKGKIEVKRGVDDDIQTTGLNREDVIGLAFDCDFEGTLRYSDVTLYRNVYYGAGTTATVDLATGSFDLFSQRGSYSHRVAMPFMDIISAKVNRLDPDGKTVYVDVVGASRKNATHSVFAITRTPDASSYLVA